MEWAQASDQLGCFRCVIGMVKGAPSSSDIKWCGGVHRCFSVCVSGHMDMCTLVCVRLVSAQQGREAGQPELSGGARQS